MLFPSLTQLRTLKMDGLLLSDAVLCAIAQHCPHMECISMKNTMGYTNAGVLALATHLHKLTTLAIGYKKSVLGDLDVGLMKRCFPRLSLVIIAAIVGTRS